MFSKSLLTITLSLQASALQQRAEIASNNVKGTVDSQEVPHDVEQHVTDVVKNYMTQIKVPEIVKDGNVTHVADVVKSYIPEIRVPEVVKDGMSRPSWLPDFIPNIFHSESSSFCTEGKLMPKLYLLGAPKCASTSLAEDILRGAHEGGVELNAAPKPGSQKEWHFWNKFTISANVTKNRQQWLDELQQCPDEKVAMLGDFNVNNLAAVPFPEDMSVDSMGPCSCVKEEADEDELKARERDVPSNLVEAYGGDIGRVTFVVMIREPLSRMQSAWYHAQYENFAKYWGFEDCCQESFNIAVKKVTGAGTDLDGKHPKFHKKMGGEGNVWVSMYARHLEAYLKVIPASQFVIVPYKQYFDGAKEEICDEIATRLDVKVCKEGGPLHDEESHPHPPLEEDIDPKLLKQFQNMMQPQTDRLIEVLGQMHQSGSMLAGYKGTSATTDIGRWLLDSW